MSSPRVNPLAKCFFCKVSGTVGRDIKKAKRPGRNYEIWAHPECAVKGSRDAEAGR